MVVFAVSVVTEKLAVLSRLGKVQYAIVHQNYGDPRWYDWYEASLDSDELDGASAASLIVEHPFSQARDRRRQGYP